MCQGPHSVLQLAQALLVHVWVKQLEAIPCSQHSARKRLLRLLSHGASSQHVSDLWRQALHWLHHSSGLQVSSELHQQLVEALGLLPGSPSSQGKS
jgi:hypothetical protein